MKNAPLVLIVLLSVCCSVHAQLPDIKKETADVSGLANPGKLISQFSNAIEPTSFLSNWSGEKSSWMEKAGKITNAIGMAQSISSLVGFLKPTSFKNGFDVQSLLKTAATVKTMTGATGLLRNLEGGLKPDAFLSSWGTQKSGWLNALNLLK